MKRAFVFAMSMSLLGGCSGLGAQRPIGNALKAPAGWTEFPIPVKVAVNPLLGMWTHGDAASKDPKVGDFIMLLRFPSDDNKPLTDKIMMTAGAKDATVSDRKDVTLCNGAKGVKMHMKATTQTTGAPPKQLDMDVVAGQGKGEALIAIYAHPIGSQPDPSAVAAVENLCPILDSKS